MNTFALAICAFGCVAIYFIAYHQGYTHALHPRAGGISWKCKLGFHKWSAWDERFEIPGALFRFEFQQRACLKCGRVGQRTV